MRRASIIIAAWVLSCGSDRRSGFETQNPESIGGGAPAGDGFGKGPNGAPSDLPKDSTADPVSCEEAKSSKSYVGCDYWPTVTANGVWSIFDFAVVVSNVGATTADVVVTGPNGVSISAKVSAGSVEKIFLPWVPSLKGPDCDECGVPQPISASVVAPGGAYHLTSSVPVIVYQFNALQYKGAGGPSGKNWSACPGTSQSCQMYFPMQPIGCFSFSNDASLLLPSTALTGNYRVVGQHGWSEAAQGPILGSTLTITATQPSTTVTVSLSSTARVLASSNGVIPASNGGGSTVFELANAGDVVELVGAPGDAYDFSGSLVQSDKPVQVIAGNPCINLPAGKAACDHIEETVLPAETLGKHYVVTLPTGPKGKGVSHVVRLYGNKDGTTLTYAGTRPPGCPTTLNAGQVADCGIVTTDFDVSGTQEFAVATFLLGAQHHDPFMTDKRGDPDQTIFAAVEQFRTKYAFLAPDDYSVSYVDVTAPANADVLLDGKPLPGKLEPIGTGGFGVQRVMLQGGGGAHTITSKLAVGVQVVGYGDFTSYEYPGGVNLKLIAPPPVPK